jgi:hypothetical protein
MRTLLGLPVALDYDFRRINGIFIDHFAALTLHQVLSAGNPGSRAIQFSWVVHIHPGLVKNCVVVLAADGTNYELLFKFRAIHG